MTYAAAKYWEDEASDLDNGVEMMKWINSRRCKNKQMKNTAKEWGSGSTRERRKVQI